MYLKSASKRILYIIADFDGENPRNILSAVLDEKEITLYCTVLFKAKSGSLHTFP